MYKWILAALIALMTLSACTQETQNRVGRMLQNWTGTNGILEVYSAGKLMKRFIRIDKLSTAKGTQENISRPYRYGYGYLDENQNGIVDDGEKRVYFEFSDYSTEYVFYESPDS